MSSPAYSVALYFEGYKKTVTPALPISKVLSAFCAKKAAYFSGNGSISGTVKVKGSPNYAVARQVILFVEPQFVPLASVWSDPVTGEYTFDYLDPTLKYMVVSINYPNNFRAVLADNLSPTPMP